MKSSKADIQKLIIRMPSDPKESFRAHSNYIQAFKLLVHNPLASVPRNLFSYLKAEILDGAVLYQPNAVRIDLEQIRSSLNAAWGTDALLSMTSRIVDEDELLRLSNNWSAIQVYYIFYHCTQALHLAKGYPRPESHPKTQNLFYDHWAARPICIPPWSLAFGSEGARNAPPGISPDVSIHVWAACEGDNIWNLAFKALMTTRRESLDEKRKELRESKRRENRRSWKKEESDRRSRGIRLRHEPIFRLPRLTDQEKQQMEAHLRPFTIMDYLYRVRIKTNYEDSNMFSDGPENPISSRLVRNALCTIARATLFLHELAIANLIGRDTFLDLADTWIRRNIPHNQLFGLAARRRYIA